MSNGNDQNVDVHIRGKVDGSLKAAAGDARNTIGDLKDAVVDNAAQMTGVSRDLLSSVTNLAPRFLLVGGAVAVMAKAYADGVAEVKAMNLAIGLGGDISGQTAASMRTLSADIATHSRMTIAESKELASAMASSGQIGAGAFEKVGRVAGDFARVMGTDVARIGPELVKLFDDPAKGAEELNKRMHFLSAAELDHISHLVRMGEVTQAQIELAGKLGDRMGEIVPKLGYVERAWDGVKGAASKAWDAMMGVGREQTTQQRLDAILGRIKDVEAMGAGARNLPTDKQVPALMREALKLQDQLEAESQKSFDKSQAAEKNRRDQTARTLANSLSKNARAEAIDDEIKLLEAADLRADIKAQAIAKKREERAKLFKEKAGPKSPLEKMLELGQGRIDVLNSTGYDEQTVSVDSVARQYAAKDDADLEKRRVAMEKMAEARMENTRIATEGEEAIREAMEKTGREIKKTDSFAKDLGLTFASAFEDAALSGKKFSEVLEGLGNDLRRILLRKTVTEPAGKMATDFIDSSGIGNFISGLFKNAAGGVYSSPDLHRHANTVVTSPTLFKFAKGGAFTGLMGEAGAEAIMPLKRGADGKLGVAGGGSNVVVNVIESPGKGGQQERRNDGGVQIIDIFVERVKAAISTDIANGRGSVPDALQTSYGLNRVAGAY